MKTSQMIKLIDKINTKHNFSDLDSIIEFFIEDDNKFRKLSLADYNPYYGQIRLVDEQSENKTYQFRKALARLKKNDLLRFKYGFDNYSLVRCIISHNGLSKVFRIELMKM